MKYISDYKAGRILQWVLYYILRPFVQFEYFLWHKFKKNNGKIKRMFSSTGNISLINILTIINEIGDFDKYEDYLFIDTGKGRKEFIEKQYEIASLHKFKKIFVGYQINSGVVAVFNNFFKVDIAYVLNHVAHVSTIMPLYKNAKIILIDEGSGSLISFGSGEKNKSFKTHKYLGKIDFLNTGADENITFEDMDINEFNKIADILEQKYPIDVEIAPEDKTIMYCGIYWEVTGYSKQDFDNIQKKVIEDLLKAGYKILYKPHPRDNEFYGFDKNPNVRFITSKLPIEIYNLDILAIVSVCSTASLNSAHYRNIPGFSHIKDESLKKSPNGTKMNLIKCMIKEYSPDYSELLKFDVRNTSKDELKHQIKNLYSDFINSKPLLSQNKKIIDYAKGTRE